MADRRVFRVELALGLAMAAGLAFPAATQEPAPVRAGAVYALLLNGGNQPASNFLSHLQHLQEMVGVLQRRGVAPERIDVFSADGEDPAADLATRRTAPPDFWLLEGTTLGNRLNPSVEIVNTPWRQARLHPARVDALRQWFVDARTRMVPGDRLIVFVTDHGGRGGKEPGSGTIWLWRQQLTVRELRSMLDLLAPQVQVVTVMSQCYSGAFADLMYDRGLQEPSGNTCGFFATSADDKAYGCYPEGQDQKRMGYAFDFIDALDRQPTTAAAHADVVRWDSTPDRPRSTSDAYLAQLVSREALARGVDPDELTDSLLATAWRRRAVWEPEIRQLDAIGESFGTFSPRSLKELKTVQQNLASLADQVTTYSTRWNTGLVDVKVSLLNEFLAARPDWRTRLDSRTVEQLPAGERAALLAQLLTEFKPFAQQSAGWSKLERFREAASSGSEATWRFEVRKAAADRMRTILLTIAGRELIDGAETQRRPGGEAYARASQRAAYAALAKCETFAPGTVTAQPKPASTAVRTSFPSLSDDRDLLQAIQPSWLGVRYGATPAALRNAFPALAGAAQVQGVEENSPAAEAGLMAGDVILGPPERPFKSSADLLDWTLTSPRETYLALKAFRLERDSHNGREFDVTVYLRPLAVGRALTGALRLGTPAPQLPNSLKSARAGQLPDLHGRPHLRFFWATWCGPCKAALPEVMAFAAAKSLPVLAITDEDEATVSRFLKDWTKPFFESVALDPYRMSFLSHGVSGTPTIVLVDADGVVRHRQVGYSAGEGLTMDGWRWSAR